MASGQLAGDGSTWRELMRGTGCGIIFGLSSPLIGHPLDTIKTKMQAQAGYVRGSSFATLSAVVRNEGALALWRGLAPPLVGSMVYRSVQFGAYSAAFAACKDVEVLTTPRPMLGDMQLRVVVGGLASATARAFFETPLEHIKVRRQTGQAWRVAPTWQAAIAAPHVELRNAFGGFGITWLRCAGLMTTFFMMVDTGVRHWPELMTAPLVGPFLKGGVCATVAWWLIWPWENLKNQVQAGAEGVAKDAGWVERARFVLRERGGVLGLYRGIGPGSLRSIVANGAGMVIMTACLTMFSTEEEKEGGSGK
mmetsp:Transcript_4006/g.14897  ORF Transcript_4006/g.14897 Transcript_4006/m.14897 type:complete len:308 (-) Transcript_4006:62-985(-)